MPRRYARLARPLLAAAMLLAAPPAVAQHRPETVRARGAEAPLAQETRARAARPAAPFARPDAAEDVRIQDAFELDGAIGAVVTEGGLLVAAGSLSGTVVAHDAATGAFVWGRLTCGQPTALDAGADVVAVACERPGEIVLHDAATGAIRSRRAVGGYPVAVAVSADGTAAAVGADLGGRTTVVETATGAVRASFDGRLGFRTTYRRGDSQRQWLFADLLRLSPDGSRAVVGSGGTVRTYAGASGALVASAALPGDAYVLDLSADGARALVLTETSPGSVPAAFFYEVATGALTELALPSTSVGPLYVSGAISADGQRALVYAGRRVDLLAPGAAPVPLGASGIVVPLGHDRAALLRSSGATRIDLSTGAARGSTDGALFFTGSRTDAFRAYDGATAAMPTRNRESARVATLGDDDAPREVLLGEAAELDAPRYVAVSPDGTTAAASLSYSGHVAIVDVATRTVRAVADVGAEGLGYPAGIAFLSNDEVLVAGHDGTFETGSWARVATDGTVTEVVATDVTSYRDVFVSADGSRALLHSPFDFGTAYAYDVGADGLTLASSGEAGGNIGSSVAFGTGRTVTASADASVVVAQAWEQRVVVYDVEAGTTSYVDTPDFLGGEIALSTDGARALAVAGFPSRDAYLIALDGTPALLRTVTLPFFGGPATFDADAGEFVVGSTDFPGALARLDVQTGAARGSVALPPSLYVEALAWSPETGLVAAGQETGLNGTGGVVLTEAGAFAVAGAPARLATSGLRGEVVLASPGPDAVSFVQAGAVASEPAAGGARLRVRALGTPASEVAVRVEGAPRDALRVEVVDALGRTVARLHDGAFGGRAVLRWDGAAPGVYVVRVVGEAASARVTVAR